jgi:uncharacterized repeat protein (TIGR02543 family)
LLGVFTGLALADPANGVLELETNTSTAELGDRITVTLNLTAMDAAEEFDAWQAKFTYDDSVLQVDPTSCEINDLFGGHLFNCNTGTSGQVYGTSLDQVGNTSGTTPPFLLMTIAFDVIGVGETNFTVVTGTQNDTLFVYDGTSDWWVPGTINVDQVTATDTEITGLTVASDEPTAIGDTTAFTASITAGTNVSYTWDFDDGTVVTTDLVTNTTHTYLAAGEYTVIVTATNTHPDSPKTAQTIVRVIEPITGLAADNDSPTVAGDTTHFTATITSNEAGVTYDWDFGDGAGTATGANPSYVYPAPGNYTAIVTASNAIGGGPFTATTSVTITNQAPTSNAGTDQSVDVNASVQLDGSASSDPDGHVLTYGWVQIGGELVTLSDDSVVDPTFTAPGTPDVLTFTLTVTDPYGLADSDDVVITVNEIAITDLVATNDSPTTLGQPTQFTATVATGSNVMYTWSFGETGANPSYTYPAADAYTAIVTATNDAGVITATTEVTITNEMPIADAGEDQTVLVDTLVTLDGSGSSDPDGHTPLTYGWVQTGGADVTLSDPTVVAPTFTAPTSADVLTFTLVVTDAYGLASDPAEVVITVYNNAPTADAGTDQNPLVDTQVQLDGSGSSDADGHALTYGWSQTGGTDVALSDASAISPTFTAPTSADVLTFTLVVTDAYGLASNPDVVVITVYNTPPVADAGTDQNPLVDTQVQLDGSGSSDADGHALTYGWSQTGGTDVALSDASAISPTFTAPTSADVLTFTLVVTDAYGLASTPDEVVINVTEAPEPNIVVSPLSLSAELAPGETAIQILTIENTGSADLDWTLTEDPAVSWLDEDMTSGTIAAPAEESVTVEFNATGLDDGIYNTTLQVSSNDPDTPEVNVSVVLTVATPVVPTYTLTMAVDGNGTVEPAVGDHVYEENTLVDISATADTGWEFSGWLGEVTSPDLAETTVMMNENKVVTATFTEIPVETYDLTVNTVGQGSVAMDPTGGTYDAGTVVTLTATPDTDWQFAGWSGDLTGTTNPDTITMDANKVVTATFTEVGVCTPLDSVTLALVSEDIYMDDPLAEFSVTLAPITATTPFTYVIAYGDGVTATATTMETSFTLSHTYPMTEATYTADISVWGCDMAEVTDSVGVEVKPYIIYLPLVTRNFGG